jgi:hypothetical protein
LALPGSVAKPAANFLEMVMDKLAFALAIALSIVPCAGHAQEREDMTQVTCTNYLIMSPDMARTFSAWMSGWYNQKFGYTTVGLDDYGRNVANVHQWCTDRHVPGHVQTIFNL